MTDTSPSPEPHETATPPPPAPAPRSIVVAYTHARRAETLAATLADFDAVGLPVAHVEIQTRPPKQAHNRLNAYQALKTALERHVSPRDAPGVLLIEDDVIPSSTLPAWLEHVERTQERPVAFYTPTSDRWYPMRLWRVARGERRASRSEICTAENLARWWGAQAVWLPTEWVRSIVLDERMQIHEHGLGPWDHALRRLILERGATLGIAVPNQVQHRQERNLVTPAKRPSRSATFENGAPPPAR